MFSVKCNAILLITILIVIGIANGCRSSKTAAIELPNIREIEISEGGGASGFWNGFIIKSNGEIFKWSSTKESTGINQVEKNIKEFKTIDSAKLKEIWQEINNSEISKINYKNPGNYSCSLKILFESRDYYALWEKNSIDDKTKSLQSIYDKIMSYITD